ncbi:S41 family peptidase [Parasediminibacterium sp. JCM 36343]|uniref:S41 family peptidase n=1 Tax=Parasediminibacterium sp. JCM 36343 TaxID=3374279 RepID=UPI00397A590C
MKKNNNPVLILLFSLFASCISTKIPNYHFNQKTSAPQLREDIRLLQTILEANHPSLYWYMHKDSIDYYFNTAYNSITDSLPETAFRNKAAFCISKIHCGHTAVRFSANYTKLAEKHRYPQFPLSIKTWGDSMVALGSYNPKDTIFKRGTIITSINGRGNKEILDSMFQLLSSDGYAYNFKSQIISGNFPTIYKQTWGLDSSYCITYIGPDSKRTQATIVNYTPERDTTAKKKPIQLLKDTSKHIVVVKKPTRKQRKIAAMLRKRSLSIDTANSTGYMQLATFSEGHLGKFFRKSFKALHSIKCQNLIIDLRENTGGYVSNRNLLTKYLINKAFKNGDTLAAITQSVKHPYYVKEALKYWFSAHFGSHKMADGRYHNRRGEHHFYYPKTNHHFNGHIYIIQGGYTFSAATMFASAVKGQKNVTIVGEESGGGYYGNTAMYMPTIILPNSKLQVIMPMFRLVMDSTRAKNGRGVWPDMYLNPSSTAIKNGIDLKLATVKALIDAYLKK